MTNSPLTYSQRALTYFPYLVIAIVAFSAGAFFFGGDSAAPTNTDAHAHSKTAKEDWTCSMDPQVHADSPGPCPKCGMALVQSTLPKENVILSNDDKVIEVVLSPDTVLRESIRTELVVRKRFRGLERRLLGRIQYDESRIHWVKSWIGGTVETVNIGTPGQLMRQGQLVAAISGDEVRAVYEEVWAAKNLASKQGLRELEKAAASAKLESVRDRLRLLGCQKKTMDLIEESAEVQSTVQLRSPHSGTLVSQSIDRGDEVRSDTNLFQIADLTRVWINVDATGSDLSILKPGQEVIVLVEKIQDEEFLGKVIYVNPVANERLGTHAVRVEVANGDGRLQPGTFAEVVVSPQSISEIEGHVVIPDTAPLFTGRRSLVYVEVPNRKQPTYEARTVRLGEKTDGLYPVQAGLSAGERVVVHGTFQIDSDLQIRGGESMIASDDDDEQGPYDHIVLLSDSNKKRVAQVVANYLAIGSHFP